MDGWVGGWVDGWMDGSGGLKTNSPPSFSIMVSEWSIPENQTEVLTAKATDPDGDTLTYSVGGEDASIFSVTNFHNHSLLKRIQSSYSIPLPSN